MSSQSVLETEALDEVERRLTAQGYTLIREPGHRALPEFLGSFRPDAIATGKLPNLIVEVIARRGSSDVEAAKLKQLQHMVEGRPDWMLEVVYTAPSGILPRVASAGAIRDRLLQVTRLAKIDAAAALIMGWSLLEAAARAIMPDRAAKGLTPATTIELLTSLGYVTQPEADLLREAGKSRNLIVHGDVGLAAPEDQLRQVLAAVEEVLGHLDSGSSD